MNFKMEFNDENQIYFCLAKSCFEPSFNKHHMTLCHLIQKYHSGSSNLLAGSSEKDRRRKSGRMNFKICQYFIFSLSFQLVIIINFEMRMASIV
jgi:hypothetical protein